MTTKRRVRHANRRASDSPRAQAEVPFSCVSTLQLARDVAVVGQEGVGPGNINEFGIATAFSTSVPVRITSCELRLWRAIAGGISGNYQIGIYAASGGVPTGPQLAVTAPQEVTVLPDEDSGFGPFDFVEPADLDGDYFLAVEDFDLAGNVDIFWSTTNVAPTGFARNRTGAWVTYTLEEGLYRLNGCVLP